MIQIGKDGKKMIHWEVSALCNYRCEYCYQKNKTLHNKKYLETAKVIRDVILPIYKPDRIEILGGEISILDPELCKIISEFNPNNYGFIHFVTNGSNLDWFLPIKNIKHFLVISIHESQTNIDELINNIYKYKKFGLNITVTMILTKYNSEVVRYAKNKINNLIIIKEKDENIESIDNELLSMSRQIIVNNEKKVYFDKIYKPCKCKSNMIRINIDGEILFCNASDIRQEFVDNKSINDLSNDEIKKTINNILNNPIVYCKSACYPCFDNIVQYFDN